MNTKTARKFSENETQPFCNHFRNISSHLGCVYLLSILELRLLPTFRGQKNRFSFYLTKFKSVNLSNVYKAKILKISKSGRIIQKEKKKIQIKLINCEGVIILSTGETSGEIFAAKAHRSYFMLFVYFYLYHVLDKIPTWKLLKLTLMEKSKAEESPWVKKTSKTRLIEIEKGVAMRCFSREILIYCHRR